MNIFNIGPMELLLILVVVLIVFGPNKLPEVGSSIGSALRKFRQASKELSDELDLEELNPSTVLDVLAAQGDAADAKAKEEKKTEQEHPAPEPASVSASSAAPDALVDAPSDANETPAPEPASVSVSSAAPDAPVDAPSDADETPAKGAAVPAASPEEPPAASPRFIIPESSLAAAAGSRRPESQSTAEDVLGVTPTPESTTPEPPIPTTDHPSPEDEMEHERQH